MRPHLLTVECPLSLCLAVTKERGCCKVASRSPFWCWPCPDPFVGALTISQEDPNALKAQYRTRVPPLTRREAPINRGDPEANWELVLGKKLKASVVSVQIGNEAPLQLEPAQRKCVLYCCQYRCHVRIKVNKIIKTFFLSFYCTSLNGVPLVTSVKTLAHCFSVL